MIEIDDYTKDAICQYFNENYPQFPGAEVKDILSTRVEDSDIIVLMDCGIKGIPKITIRADKLQFVTKPEVEFPGMDAKDTIGKSLSPAKPKVKRPTNGRRKRGVKK
jgi:hypothetical protein